MFFTVFPDSCISYGGPHSLECVSEIWKDSGCDENGVLHPEFREDFMKNELLNLPIR